MRIVAAQKSDQDGVSVEMFLEGLID